MIYYIVMNASNVVIGRLSDQTKAINLARANGGYMVPIKARQRSTTERY